MRSNKYTSNFAFALLLSTIFLFFISPQPGFAVIKSGSGGAGFPMSFADLAAEVQPAVVNISTTSTVKVPGSPFRHYSGPEGDFFRQFFGEMPDRELKEQSLGSGVIIDKDGYIVTNNHMVESAEEIKVKLTDGRDFKAKVIGRDPKTDLALIRISAAVSSLPFLPLGDSGKMRVGDWVLAVGNPFGLEHTVTQGIISATGRVIGAGPYDNFLQTDAPINPGNSGGPLINLAGEVIGINTAIVSTGQGIGFAIPINTAKTIIPQLKEKGKVIRGWIGVSVQSVTPEIAGSFGLKEAKGALVAAVVQGGPADSSGIKSGDVIVSFGGKKVSKVSDLPLEVAEEPVGKVVPVKILRNGKELDLTVKIAEMPAEAPAAAAVPSSSALGVTVEDITPRLMAELNIRDRAGAVVVNVSPGSPADFAGIRAGDVVKEVNHTPISNLRDYEAAMKKSKKGEPVLFLVKRGEQTFYVSIAVS